MTDEQYDAFVGLLMISDPFPTVEADEKILKDFADEEARKRGFSDWVEAYNFM